MRLFSVMPSRLTPRPWGFPRAPLAPLLGASVLATWLLGMNLLAAENSAAAENSVAAELRQLVANFPNADALIARLGEDSFRIREDAAERLLAMPLPPIPALEKAAKSADLEVRTRARRLLNSSGKAAQARLNALLEQVRLKRIKGLCKEILTLYSYMGESDRDTTFGQALMNTVEKSDEPCLTRNLKSEHASIRAAAATALSMLECEPETVAALGRLASDPDVSVKLAAAESLAQMKSPACLPLLVDLLNSPDPKLRTTAAISLQTVSGRKFGFFQAADAREREAVIQQWRGWIVQNKQSARIRRPLLPASTQNPFD
ncbi:MAG: HEAT repeat domain-containing protein [Planctomycetales bacterium]